MQKIQHHRFKKIMVANRGEIAIRVLRAASELGLRTVAIYTHEDRYSLHRYKADEAYQIGDDDAPLKPYLDIEEIIKTAKKNGVEAIHPGYGFLSENVDFARRCREEGIRFVGWICWAIKSRQKKSPKSWKCQLFSTINKQLLRTK